MASKRKSCDPYSYIGTWIPPTRIVPSKSSATTQTIIKKRTQKKHTIKKKLHPPRETIQQPQPPRQRLQNQPQFIGDWDCTRYEFTANPSTLTTGPRQLTIEEKEADQAKRKHKRKKIYERIPLIPVKKVPKFVLPSSTATEETVVPVNPPLAPVQRKVDGPLKNQPVAPESKRRKRKELSRLSSSSLSSLSSSTSSSLSSSLTTTSIAPSASKRTLNTTTRTASQCDVQKKPPSKLRAFKLRKRVEYLHVHKLCLFRGNWVQAAELDYYEDDPNEPDIPYDSVSDTEDCDNDEEEEDICQGYELDEYDTDDSYDRYSYPCRPHGNDNGNNAIRDADSTRDASWPSSVLAGDGGIHRVAGLEQHQNRAGCSTTSASTHPTARHSTSTKQAQSKDQDVGFSRTNIRIELDVAEANEIAEHQRHVRTAQLQSTPRLLLDKCTPTELADIVGQDAALAEMRQWMRNFKARTPGMPHALLLVGPSGVGKSSCARLLMREFGLRPYVYSAGDYIETDSTNAKKNFTVYSPRGIHEVIYKLVARSSVFEPFGVVLDDIGLVGKNVEKLLVSIIRGQYHANLCPKKRPERVWHAPIICVCSRENETRIRALLRVSHVVQMARVTSAALGPFLTRVCAQEGLSVPVPLANTMISGCNGDVRRLLNALHILGLSEITQDNGGVDLVGMYFEQADRFEMLRYFVHERHAPEATIDRLTPVMSLHPVSLAGLLHENYLRILAKSGRDKRCAKMTPRECRAEELEQLDRAANAIDLFSASSNVVDAVYTGHNWDFLELSTTLTTWGVSQFIPKEGMKPSTVIRNSQVKGKTRKGTNHAKVIRGLDTSGESAVAFIDRAQVYAARIEQHNETPSEELPRYFKDTLRYNYKDVQALWGTARLRAGTMPNPRGKYSLRKWLLESGVKKGKGGKKTTIREKKR